MMMERKDKVEPLVNMLKKQSIQIEDSKTAKATVDTDKRQLLDKLRQERVAYVRTHRYGLDSLSQVDVCGVLRAGIVD
ncbi:hypothetical protein PsorP6_009867 [Peronosclerospora sorghi]|uniref:Uncharacterized protein n=1 Tax=Peronosclerospora sorghi TaxID=230839 RepID=A0ACC0W0I7_9STRA|nr:hypothetical protein PsorP6_009867 [Peronosclerospora sorghi]